MPNPIRRFTVDEYHRMIDAGVFADDDRVELLEGLLVARANETPREAATRSLTDRCLWLALPDGWSYRPRCGVSLADSEPEPDAAVVRGEIRSYMRRHPHASDIALVVEVADATLEPDRIDKARIYARAAIPTYWIVNVAEGRVEVHTDPTGPVKSPAYRSMVAVGADGELPLMLDGREVARIAARDILPL